MTPNNNSSTEIFCTVPQCKINLFLKSVVSAKFEEMKRNLVNFNATFARLKIFCETLPLIDEDGWGSRALSKMSKLPQRFKHDNFSIVIIATTIRSKRSKTWNLRKIQLYCHFWPVSALFWTFLHDHLWSFSPDKLKYDLK